MERGNKPGYHGGYVVGATADRIRSYFEQSADQLGPPRVLNVPLEWVRRDR